MHMYRFEVSQTLHKSQETLARLVKPLTAVKRLFGLVAVNCSAPQSVDIFEYADSSRPSTSRHRNIDGEEQIVKSSVMRKKKRVRDSIEHAVVLARYAKVL